MSVSCMSLSVCVCKLKQLMNHGRKELNKPNIQLSPFTYLKISHQMSCVFHYVDSFVRVFFFPFQPWEQFFLADPEPLRLTD